MEVFTDIATNVLLKNESTARVMKVVLFEVDDQIVNNCHVMTGFNHFHKLMVRDFCRWCLEGNFFPAVKLKPYFKDEN